MTDDKKKVPALWLEQAALGELKDASRKALQERIDEGELARRQATLAASNEEILEALPSTTMAAAIRQRAERARRQQQTRSWMPGAWTLAPVVSLAALLLIVLSMDGTVTLESTTPETAETERIKGLSPHLVIYRKRGDAVERLAEGAKARAGDELQVAYVAARQAHGVVVSIDGAGAVTLHLSAAGQSAALSAPRETLLGESYRLDNAPAFERFFLITASHAFDVSLVEQAARQLAADPARAQRGALALPTDLQQASFTVTKVQP